MKRRIALTLEGKITPNKEKILVKFLTSIGEVLKDTYIKGQYIETVAITSKQILDLD